MVSKKFSSIRPVGDGEMAETSLIGGPQVAREPGELLLRFLCVLLGLSTCGLLYMIGQTGYCLVLESKIEAVVQPELKLESATISLHELTSQLTNIAWEVTLVAINPNTEIGLNCHDSVATVLFDENGHGFLMPAERGSLPNFFISDGTQKVIRFKFDMVRWRNDPVVSRTVRELGRTPGSVTSFGLRIDLVYSFDNKKMCAVNCHGRKRYWWDHVTFQGKEEASSATGISFLQI